MHTSPPTSHTNTHASAYHVRFLSQNRPGPRMGMGHYERLLLQALMHSDARAHGWQFDMRFAGRAPADFPQAALAEMGLSAATFLGYSPARLASLPWPVARTAITLSHRQPPPDLYHSLALSYPAPAGRPAVYTIHDLPPARFDDEGTLPRWAQQAAASAQAIVTPSEFARRELVELLGLSPAKVHVVPNGYEQEVFHAAVAPAHADALAAHGLHSPFLLYAGGGTRRKNVAALLQAWRQVAAQHPRLSLALAGPADLLQALADASNAPRVVVTGYLERAALPGILKAATALVCPSIYEGFGLPPLEAMALGVPVVGVQAGAIPEVTAGCAVLADDGTPDALAHALRTLLGDDALAERLRQCGPARAAHFSWPEHARRVLDIYRAVLGTSRA